MSDRELLELASKARQARELHDCALILGEIPGRERDCNIVSKEAARADAEVTRLAQLATQSEKPENA